MPSQAIIFYQPRSACRVMMRMVFDKQTNIDKLLNLFSPARGAQVGWLRSDSYEDGMSEPELQAFNDSVQKDITTWQERLKSAQEQNKTLLVQTYPFSPVSPNLVLEYMKAIKSTNLADTDTSTSTVDPGIVSTDNFTLIPSSLLLTPGTLPILVIRNPRVTVPSAFRVLKTMGIPNGGGYPMALMTTSLIWIRALYDYFTTHGIEPLVLDADDFLSERNYVRKLCERIGVDESLVKFSWDAISEEEKGRMHPMEFLSARELFVSKGPDERRAVKNMTRKEVEGGKWKEEFGDDDAKMIEELVGYGIGLYEYLFERRWKI